MRGGARGATREGIRGATREEIRGATPERIGGRNGDSIRPRQHRVAAWIAVGTVALALSAWAAPASAQTLRSIVRVETVDLTGTVSEHAGDEGAIHAELALNELAEEVLNLIALVARSEDIRRFLRASETARTDKQVGADAGGSGTTSLVTKGSVPRILGFAVENGALTRAENGTTITFRGTPAGIASALRRTGITILDRTEGLERVFSRLSFGVSFDASRGDEILRGTSETGAGDGETVFTGSREELSAFSFKYEIINDRDPSSPAYAERFERLFDESLHDPVIDLTREIQAFRRLINEDEALRQVWDAWQARAAAALAAADGTAVEEAVVDQLADLVSRLRREAEIMALATRHSTTYGTFLASYADAMRLLGDGPLLSVEYANDRPAEALPSTSTVRMIAEFPACSGRCDVTTNAALTFYNETGELPEEIDALRDASLSAQFDYRLGALLGGRVFVWSTAARYARLQSTPATFEAEDGTATLAFSATRADQVVLQTMLNIPVGASGVKVPLSLSWANRSPLVDESHLRGSFGVTLDLDSVFGTGG